MTENLDTTEDLNTKDLTASDKLDLVISRLTRMEADLTQVKAELTDLRAWREDRARATNPKLELIHKEVADLNAGQTQVQAMLHKLEGQFQEIIIEQFNFRGRQRDFEVRVRELEYAAAANAAPRITSPAS